jgi:predicted nucleic acid-binding protein
MTRIFADACYWIALLHRNDQLHSAAVASRNELKNAQVVTTDEVLAEVLNFFSGRNQMMRALAVQVVEELRCDARATVVEQSRASFDRGLGLYKSRGDKQWSLVDCVSFELMRRDGIAEALTADQHFVQAGFVARFHKPRG